MKQMSLIGYTAEEYAMLFSGRNNTAETSKDVKDFIQLREYQERAVVAVRSAITPDCKKIIKVLPTGSGKSVIMSEIIRLACEKGKKVLWLVHRRNLVIQMRATLQIFGIEAGILMSGIESDTSKQVQIGTYQTYQRRLKFEDGLFFVNADLLLIDECHRSLSKGYIDIINLYRDKVIIGCTATPMRADGRGVGEIYDKIVDVVGVQELTDQGFLAKARYFAPADIDLQGIKIVRGDYDTHELEKRADKAKLVGDIIQNWLRIAQNRPTIVFCVTVKHSVHVCEEFNKAGIPALSLSAKSTDEEREYAFGQMESGKITVLVNVALYQEGMDCPNISCVVMARPTKSLGLYRQCCGRGLRPKKDGGDLIVIDHGGCFENHGYLTDEVEWSLDGKKKAFKEKKKKDKEKKTVKCPSCHAIFEGLSVCPDCGTEMKTFGKKIETIDADLQEIGERKQLTMIEKRRWFGMFKHYAQSHGYKSGWVAHKYKSKTGVWPRGMDDVQAILPDHTCANWITYQNIKNAKQRAKA